MITETFSVAEPQAEQSEDLAQVVRGAELAALTAYRVAAIAHAMRTRHLAEAVQTDLQAVRHEAGQAIGVFYTNYHAAHEARGHAIRAAEHAREARSCARQVERLEATAALLAARWGIGGSEHTE